jgi:hypothetical protein
MSSKQGTSGSGGGGGQDRGQNVTHQDVAQERRKQREKRKTKQTKEGQSLVAKNIESDRRKYSGKTKKYLIGGKKDVGEMYGGKASQMTNEYLVSIGEAKRGNAYYDHKGKITGYSYMITAQGKEMKYGKSGGAMGSGDPTGIMTGTPISEQMHESQKEVQRLMKLGPMGLLTSTATKDTGYDSYLKKFYGNMAGTSSYGIKSAKVSGQGTTEDFSEVASTTQADPNRTETRTDTTRYKSSKAITKSSESILASRNLFGKKGKTITASMV